MKVVILIVLGIAGSTAGQQTTSDLDLEPRQGVRDLSLGLPASPLLTSPLQRLTLPGYSHLLSQLPGAGGLGLPYSLMQGLGQGLQGPQVQSLGLGLSGPQVQSLGLGLPGAQVESLGLGLPGAQVQSLRLGLPGAQFQGLAQRLPASQLQNFRLGLPSMQLQSLLQGMPGTQLQNLRGQEFLGGQRGLNNRLGNGWEEFNNNKGVGLVPSSFSIHPLLRPRAGQELSLVDLLKLLNLLEDDFEFGNPTSRYQQTQDTSDSQFTLGNDEELDNLLLETLHTLRLLPAVPPAASFPSFRSRSSGSPTSSGGGYVPRLFPGTKHHRVREQGSNSATDFRPPRNDPIRSVTRDQDYQDHFRFLGSR